MSKLTRDELAWKAIRESENESDTSPLTPYGKALERIGQLRQALSWVIDEASVLGLDRMPGDTMEDFCKACHEARAVLADGDAVECVACGRSDAPLHTNMRCGNCGREA